MARKRLLRVGPVSDWCANGGDNCKQAATAKILHGRVSSELDKRWHVLHPFTLDPIQDGYRHMFDDQEWAALHLLLNKKKFESVWGYNSRIDIESSIRTGAGSHCYKIRLTLTTSMPNVDVAYHSLPPPIANYIDAWVIEWIRYRDEKAEILSTLKSLCGHCSSPGQIIRVWPAMLGFFDMETKEELTRKKKARSPLPQSILETDEFGRRKILDPFRRSRLDAFESILTEALILPTPEEHPKLASYPDLTLL